jgi:predicted dehydrogenase
MSSLKVGVLGAGGIAAKLHLPEMQTVRDAEVVILAGRKPSRLQTLCQRFAVPRWTQSYDAVLSDSTIDAVIIALPHPLHVTYGLAALAAGKHVLMQKPLSTSLADADQFVAAVDQCSRTVLALPYVSRPCILQAREWVQAGRLGVVASGNARFSHGGPEIYYATIQKILNEQPGQELWFFDAAQADVGALFDMGVYAIAALCAVLGSATAVSCLTTTAAKPTQLEDTAVLLLRFASGALGTAEGGWSDGARTFAFSVHGTAGKLVNPSLTDVLEHWVPSSLVDEDAPLVRQPVDLSGQPVENAHQHWVRCIREGRQPPLANARFARHVTEIMLRGLESARSEAVVKIVSRIE